MSNDILGSLTRVLVTVPENRLGLVQDYARKLAGQDGEEWEQNGKKFLRKEPCWEVNNPPTAQVVESKPTPFIEFIGTVTTTTTDKFVVRDHFKLKQDGGICSRLGDDFEAWFMFRGGLIENPLVAQTMRYGKLLKALTDLPQKQGQQAIIPVLGGEAKVTTTMTEIHDLMVKQSNGESGVLLTDGCANIFYVLDQNGVLRTVSVYWYVDGWFVYALPVEDPFRWDDGRQVFSRNSALGSSDPS